MPGPSESYVRLLENEGLGVQPPALHTPQPGDAEERFFVEPIAVDLGRVVLQQNPGLFLRDRSYQRMEHSGVGGVGLPFEDLVAQHEMVPKHCRYEFGQ